MSDCIDGIWGVIRNVVIAAFVLALCFGIAFSGASFITGRELERRRLNHETGWRTVHEGRLCDCTTNGLYRIQIKED